MTPTPIRSTARIRIAVDYVVMESHVRSIPSASIALCESHADRPDPTHRTVSPRIAGPQRDGGTYLHGAS